MQLRLTLVTDQVQDIAVDCPRGTRWDDLRAQLAPVTGGADGGRQQWYAGASALSPDAEVGEPPLLDGATVSTRPTASDPTAGPRALLHLHVTSGPDAGQVFSLGVGDYRLGRAGEADLRIDDPDVSRTQLHLEVSATGTTVCDAGSTNGTWCGSRRVDRAEQWSIGQRLRVGSSVLELRAHDIPSAATTFDGLGHVLVNRRPRRLTASEAIEIRIPAAPGAADRARLPLLTMAVPVLLAVPMAWLQHSPAYLLFGLMSPAMMLGNVVTERRGGRRDGRRARQRWREDVDRARAAIESALSTEGAQRRHALPDCADLLDTVESRRARVWERRPGDPDAAVVRVGLGRLPARVRVIDEGAEPAFDAAGPAAVATTLRDVPLGLELRAVGALGVAGGRREALGLGRSFVAQLAGWHSPRHVRVVVLTDTEAALDSWRWATLLPHSRSDPDATGASSTVGSLESQDQVRRRVTELEALLRERRDVRPGEAATAHPAVVVVLDGARRLRSVPGLARVLADGPAVGIYAICLDRTRSDLPVECRAYVELADSDRTDQPAATDAAVTLPDGTIREVVSDRVSAAWCDRFGRALAPLRDATPTADAVGVPASCRLLDLVGHQLIEPTHLAEHWIASPRSTTTVIGLRPDGPHALDLRHDGPHLLIAGTTGAGKSELLQTLIASLALANAPTELTFVLVDYKGGAAFDQCADLPHTLGLVTDLDEHLADRALTSLTAELKRREQLLRAAGAKDLDHCLELSGDRLPPLARLVLVVDEFRMIAEELPAFLDGMVRIAALGRSLGVHLVLATQRPAGIVSADIAANVNLRIALRVRDQADSEDVIDARDAAAIATTAPGRAYARSGSNPLVLFQSARVAGRAERSQSGVCVVRTLSTATLGEPPPASPLTETDCGPTDLARIVEAAREAARLARLQPVRRPWLPPLPEVVTLAQLDAGNGGQHAAYAVVDRPEHQAQQTLTWDLSGDAHAAIIGTMRSGRTTALRTLAGSMAATFAPDELHLHAIDGGAGGLLALTRLPHVGVVAGVDQPARAVRLLDRLTDEVNRRRSLLAAGGFGSLVEHRASAGPRADLPFLVLLLDGWEGIAAALDAVDHGRPVDVLQQLLRDGPALGLRIVVTGDRGLLVSRLASLVRDKVVLRLADPSDLMVAGIPASAVPARLSPGRGVRVVDRAEVQFALLDADPSGPAQIAALGRIAAEANPPSGPGRPIRIEPLPLQVAATDLAPRVVAPPSGWALVGAGGDAGDPVGLALRGSSALVAGPARSGRSTTLWTIATWLADHGTDVVIVTAGPSTLDDLRGHARVRDVVDATESGRLRAVLARQPECCVVVDDVERVADTEAEDVVLQWFKSAERRAGSLVVAGTSADLSVLFRGLSVVARRSGSGVLLQPSTHADGDLLGIRLGVTDVADRHPGRGLLVQGGAHQPVQIATSVG